MAINTVRVQINGSWHSLTYNSASGKWEASIAAPSVTSYNLSGHYYPVTVEATNTAGTSATKDSTDATLGNSLRLVVKEKTPPVIIINSPSSGAYVTNNQQPVVATITDEANGSGVNLASLVVKLDGVIQSSGKSTTAITNGYTLTFTPQSAMADGSHTVTINVSDYDGNAATQKSTTFTVDTVAPTLNVTNPTEGAITATASLTIQGSTNDATSSPVTVAITLNSVSQGNATVTGGNFTKTVTLAEGANVIVVTATDSAGKYTSITRNVTLDTTIPNITAISISPNPVDAGATMIVSVTVS